jgi:hypothetical protein
MRARSIKTAPLYRASQDQDKQTKLQRLTLKVKQTAFYYSDNWESPRAFTENTREILRLALRMTLERSYHPEPFGFANR